MVDWISTATSRTDLLTWGTVVLQIILVFVLARVAIWLGDKVISRLSSNRLTVHSGLEARRWQTIRAVLRSVLRYSIDFVALVSILSTLGVKVEALLAGVGVVGLAVGFGAQSMVRDIITGFFILLEDQFAVGEYIATAGLTGIVQDLGLRVTKLRDLNGEYHIIPNGEITKVTNRSRGTQLASVEVSVAAHEKMDRVLLVLQEAARNVAERLTDLTEPPEVLGVVKFGETDMTFRVIAKAQPMHQWAVERELRREIKGLFEREQVDFPVAVFTTGPNLKGNRRTDQEHIPEDIDN